MTKQSQTLKAKLDKELQHVTFKGHQKVMDHLHPVTRKQKLKAIWNKELEIPLMPVAAVLMTFLLFTGIKFSTTDRQPTAATKNNQIIEVANNFYWKSAFDKQTQANVKEGR